MNVIDFFSSNSYVFLPTKNNPKVALAVENKAFINNAFNLYNPFSIKAKLFKIIIRFGFNYFNNFFKFIFRVSHKDQSPFLKYLEDKLGQKLIASVYFATANDKVVIQLQNINADVIGYLKYPLNENGLHHLKNEKNALDILSANNLVDCYILFDYFRDRPFLLLVNLDGDIDFVPKLHIIELLSRFKRNSTYLLAEHPRIIQLKKDLRIHNLGIYLPLIERLCLNSSMNYSLVYEHGDFAPWNIMKIQDEYIPFDFEHFVENGLEHFDLIKYYYQIGKLLKKKNGLKLFEFVNLNSNIPEFKTLFQMFLIKEIQRNSEECVSFDFEIDLLKHLGDL